MEIKQHGNFPILIFCHSLFGPSMQMFQNGAISHEHGALIFILQRSRHAIFSIQIPTPIYGNLQKLGALNMAAPRGGRFCALAAQLPAAALVVSSYQQNGATVAKKPRTAPWRQRGCARDIAVRGPAVHRLRWRISEI
jgi:hypothetical protein